MRKSKRLRGINVMTPPSPHLNEHVHSPLREIITRKNYTFSTVQSRRVTSVDDAASVWQKSNSPLPLLQPTSRRNKSPDCTNGARPSRPQYDVYVRVGARRDRRIELLQSRRRPARAHGTVAFRSGWRGARRSRDELSPIPAAAAAVAARAGAKFYV